MSRRQTPELDLGSLIGVLDNIAAANHDGHYTIMAFTTGYRVMFGTPDLRNGDGADEIVDNSIQFSNLKDAIINAIINEA